MIELKIDTNYHIILYSTAYPKGYDSNSYNKLKQACRAAKRYLRAPWTRAEVWEHLSGYGPYDPATYKGPIKIRYTHRGMWFNYDDYETEHLAMDRKARLETENSKEYQFFLCSAINVPRMLKKTYTEPIVRERYFYEY